MKRKASVVASSDTSLTGTATRKLVPRERQDVGVTPHAVVTVVVTHVDMVTSYHLAIFVCSIQPWFAESLLTFRFGC